MPARHVFLHALPRQARALVRVTGEDAERFLQGLLTADVGGLTPGRATPAALLTIKGKLISEMWVLCVRDEGEEDGEDTLFLAIPAELAQAVTKSLDDHIIMDDVELEAMAGIECLLRFGLPAGGAGGAGPDLPEDVLSFACAHPLKGALLLGPRAALEAVAAELEAGGSEPADAEAFTRARVEQARPAWGFEIAADRFPPEVGFVDAVSYDKGCYLGQEPLSRIHNRGQVNRVMVRVTAAEAPEGAEAVGLSAADKEIGQWTSWASSATGAGAVGLAVIKRAHAKAGTSLSAGALRVEVASGPLGDDPGGPGRKETATVKLGGR